MVLAYAFLGLVQLRFVVRRVRSSDNRFFETWWLAEAGRLPVTWFFVGCAQISRV